MAVTVYRYGLPAWVSIPTAVDDQLFVAHQLRQELITLQLEYEQRVRAVWSSHPAVADSEAERARAEERVRALEMTVRGARGRQRTHNPRHPAFDDLRVARQQLRKARQRRRDAIASAWDEDAVKERLAKAAGDLAAAQKRLYAQFCQVGLTVRGDGDEQSGATARRVQLDWATFNDVLTQHRAAVRKMATKRAQGRPAQLRRRRWDGSGTLTVQLQRREWRHGCAEKGPPWPCAPTQQGKVAAANCPLRRPNQPPRSPELLASGTGPWRRVLRITQGERHGQVLMRIGGENITLPVVVDRDMRTDADITRAQLTAQRVAGQRRWHISLTALIPEPTAKPGGPAVALRLGWRRESTGDLRVATWHSTEPIEVPHSIRDVVHQHTATSGRVVLPAAWRSRLAYYDRAQGERDRRFTAVRDMVATWLGEHPHVEPSAESVSGWRSPRQLAQLAWSWHGAAPVGAEQITEQLMAWRRWDRARWEEISHGRRKALGRRDDAWRRVAAWVAAAASTVVVNDMDLAELARRDAQRENSLPPWVQAVATRQRIHSAPGGLREAIVSASKRDGVAVVVAPAASLSACVHCGAVNEGRSITTRCEGCGRDHDRDDAATARMLERAIGLARRSPQLVGR